MGGRSRGDAGEGLVMGIFGEWALCGGEAGFRISVSWFGGFWVRSGDGQA